VEEPVSLGILRGDERLTILVDAPEAKQPTDQLADLANPDKGLVPRLGILGVDVTEKLGSILPPLRIPGGVVVAARTVEGTSQNVGLQPGDVIHAVNQAPIPSLESLRQVIQAFKPGDSVVLYVERQGRLTYLPFEID
jgi:serine protease Do